MYIHAQSVMGTFQTSSTSYNNTNIIHRLIDTNQSNESIKVPDRGSGKQMPILSPSDGKQQAASIYHSLASSQTTETQAHTTAYITHNLGT